MSASDSSLVILITGATRGIGLALTEAASAAGHRVALDYRSAQSREEAEVIAARLSAVGGAVHPLQADVSVAAEAERLVAETLERFGQWDAVVNNAGIGERIALADLDETAFTRTLHANLTSAFLVSQAAWPHMRERGGRLIFLSSGAGRTGGGLSAAYAASKAGIEGLMHAYATALRPYHITAIAIAPALIESNMSTSVDQPTDADLPMGRLGRPEEIWPALRMILATEYINQKLSYHGERSMKIVATGFPPGR